MASPLSSLPLPSGGFLRRGDRVRTTAPWTPPVGVDMDEFDADEIRDIPVGTEGRVILVFEASPDLPADDEFEATPGQPARALVGFARHLGIGTGSTFPLDSLERIGR